MHQGSVLSQLLFILVLKVLVRNLCTGVPGELPCALVRVNMKKTRLMVSSFYLDALHKSSNYPCSVCCKGISNNSTECSQCKLWVHKKCSSITGQLVTVQSYICPRCKGESRPIDERLMIQVDVNGNKVRGKVYMAGVCQLCFMVVKSRVQTSWT